MQPLSPCLRKEAPQMWRTGEIIGKCMTLGK